MGIAQNVKRDQNLSLGRCDREESICIGNLFRFPEIERLGIGRREREEVCILEDLFFPIKPNTAM